jgi:hypothetical protein
MVTAAADTNCAVRAESLRVEALEGSVDTQSIIPTRLAAGSTREYALTRHPGLDPIDANIAAGALLLPLSRSSRERPGEGFFFCRLCH